jgi:SAM-dependent methyltransferase
MNTPSSALNLSHEQREASLLSAKQALVDKIQQRGDLPYISVQGQLDLLEQLSSFDLGQFLIERGGLNGYWTHYIISHPTEGRITQRNRQGKPFHPLEDAILNSAPTCLATQQRFAQFKEQIQKRVCEGCSFASVPSGLMADLLDLDYSSLRTFSLYGIDLDPETLSQAQAYAAEKGLSEHCQFSEKDAWSLGVKDAFDLLVSNGLSIYERSDEKVVDLYRQFHTALKPGGVLITSFLTPPPAPGFKTEWNMEHVNPKDALFQKIILVDIINAKWQAYRSEETVKSELAQAGFHDIEIFYDEAHIFPTIVAKK